MKIANPGLAYFRPEIERLAEKFGLDRNRTLVESYVPNSTAIFVESVRDKKFRIHVNVQEGKIISAKQLSGGELDRNQLRRYLTQK